LIFWFFPSSWNPLVERELHVRTLDEALRAGASPQRSARQYSPAASVSSFESF
jgi:hypothetical protein